MLGVRQLIVSTGRQLDPALCHCCAAAVKLQELRVITPHALWDRRSRSSLPQPRFESDDNEAALEGPGRAEGPGPAEEGARRAQHPGWRPLRNGYRNGINARPRPRGLPVRGGGPRELPLYHVVQDVVQGNFKADQGLTARPIQRANRVPADGNGGAAAPSGPSAAERWLQGSTLAAPRPDPAQKRLSWGPQGMPYLAPRFPGPREGGPGQSDRDSGHAARNGHPRHPALRAGNNGEAQPGWARDRGGHGLGLTAESGWPARVEGNAQAAEFSLKRTRWRLADEWERPPRIGRPPQQHPTPQRARNAKMDPPPTPREASAADQVAARPSPPPPAEDTPVIELPEDVTVAKLAALLNMEEAALEELMEGLGSKPGSMEDLVDPDLAELAALERGFLVSSPALRPGKEADSEPRPAVVTVMGHVDHGKTSLLDALRKTSVAAGEAGGITQHIGAFRVVMPGSRASLTFLDTPGHAAFSAMRARGAHVTDIVVLVVDAGDGVMPQTREAIQHAREAGCPIIVALSKCDRPGADPARVRQQLLAEGLELEDAGGDVQVVETAAVKGQGLRELEEALLLQAEVMELKASRGRPAEGVVLEARLDKGQGPRATLLLRRGTLTPGQVVVVGTEWGRVRSLLDDAGQHVEAAVPGDAVEVFGLRGVPQAGDDMTVVATEERARRISEARSLRADQFRFSRMATAQRKRAQQLAQAQSALPDSADAAVEAVPGSHLVTLAVKADVQGTAEAVRDALQSLSGGSVRIHVASMGVGPVTVADVEAASARGARILAFNVRNAHAAVEANAKQRGVEIVSERVIYRLLEQAVEWLTDAAPRVAREVVLGQAQILQVFEVAGRGEDKGGRVAGCRVKEGFLRLGDTFRVLRAGEKIHEGPATSLRRGKQEVQRVGQDTECGLLLTSFQEVQPGDVLQCISTEMVAPSRDSVLQAEEGGQSAA